MFETVNFKRLCYTEFAGIMIYLHTEFHKPSSYGSLS